MQAQPDLLLPDADAQADNGAGSIFFIGNATVLIRCAGFTILTDPTFIHMHEQVSIGYGMHAKRLTDPACEIGDLPPLDLIVLSHFHGDHFDQVAERDLDRSLPIVTTHEAAKELSQRGFNNCRPLQTWSSIGVQKGRRRLSLTAMPGRHGPPLSDWVLPEVMGTLLEFQSSADAPLFKLYITGDTLAIEELSEIPRRISPINLALVHLGGTRVLGVLVTMDAAQGVELIRMVQPELVIPIHYNDYDVFKSPLDDFKTEIGAAGFTERVHYMTHGDTYNFTLPTAASVGRGESSKQK